MYTEIILSFCFSALTSATVIFLLLKSPLVKYFSDIPDQRKIHQVVVPRLGGLGLVLSFISIEIFRRYWLKVDLSQLSLSMFGTFIFIGLFLLWVGTLDDVKPLSFKIKFLFQFTLAIIIVYVFGIRFEQLSLLGSVFNMGIWGGLLSVFWLVGIMNATNIIDGVDGLAACVSIVAFITLSILAHAKYAFDIVILCMVLSGITAGFLVYNFAPRHKTFLGDTGSLFLGAMLGTLTIAVTQLPDGDHSFLVPLLIVGYPIFDTVVAMTRRYTKRTYKAHKLLRRKFLSMFLADNEHLHHRLVHWGLSHVQTTFLLTMVAATMGSVAIIISRISPVFRLLVVAYLITTLMLILNRLNYIGVKSWITFPRVKIPKPMIVGVIEPDEIFFYSLKTYIQQKLEFINIPQAMTHRFKDQFAALIIHTPEEHYFKEYWNNAIRAAEIHDCPVFVIADGSQIDQALKSRGNSDSIFPIKKPVRIPELINEILNATSRSYRTGNLYDEPKLSIEETSDKNSYAEQT